MKIFGYCRVSTSDKSAKQDYERQHYLFEHSDIEFDAIFEEHISGGVKGDQRQQFNKMLSELQENDIVCFTETSRFGRNYIDCFDMLDLITQSKKATVKFLSNGLELKGGEKLNPYEWLTISNFFIMDEFLKRQIGYNTKNALAKKKEQGIVLGKPRTIDLETEKDIVEEYRNGNSMRKVAEKFGVALATVQNYVKRNKNN